MTDPHDPDLDAVDRAARAASRGPARPRATARSTLSCCSPPCPPPTPPRATTAGSLAAAAVAALFIGSVAVLGDGPGRRRPLAPRARRGRQQAARPRARRPHPARSRTTASTRSSCPITVEPNVDLRRRRHGHRHAARASSRASGSASSSARSEAGEGNGGARASAPASTRCNIGTVQYADADDDGVATGTFTVQRVLTTPATGTVDCAARGAALHRRDGRPRATTTAPVASASRSSAAASRSTSRRSPSSPAEGLADGDVVHVEGEGFDPGPVHAERLLDRPAGCWNTGEPIELTPGRGRGARLGDEYGGGRTRSSACSPTPTAASAATCRCGASSRPHAAGSVHRLRGEPLRAARVQPSSAATRPRPPCSASPPGARPAAAGRSRRPRPATSQARRRDRRPRRRASSRASYYSISLCAAPAGDPTSVDGCVGTDGGEDQIDDDGGFAREFEIPDLATWTATSTAPPPRPARPTATAAGAMPAEGERATGSTPSASIRVESYAGRAGGRSAAVPRPADPGDVPSSRSSATAATGPSGRAKSRLPPSRTPDPMRGWPRWTIRRVPRSGPCAG